MATVIYGGVEYDVPGDATAVTKLIAERAQNPNDPWVLSDPHGNQTRHLFVGGGVPIVVKD